MIIFQTYMIIFHLFSQLNAMVNAMVNDHFPYLNDYFSRNKWSFSGAFSTPQKHFSGPKSIFPVNHNFPVILPIIFQENAFGKWSFSRHKCAFLTFSRKMLLVNDHLTRRKCWFFQSFSRKMLLVNDYFPRQ